MISHYEIIMQLMALLLLRHALSMTDSEGDDEDPSALFSVSLIQIEIIL